MMVVVQTHLTPYPTPHTMPRIRTLVDYAPTGAAKCKADGSIIGKGEVRLRLRLVFQEGTCDEMVGLAKEQQIFKVLNVAPLLQKYLALEGVTVIPASVDGLEALASDEHRQWVIDALEGRDVSQRHVPVFTPPAKNAKQKAPKPDKAEAAPAAKQIKPKKAAKLAKPETEAVAHKRKRATETKADDDDANSSDAELVD